GSRRKYFSRTALVPMPRQARRDNPYRAAYGAGTPLDLQSPAVSQRPWSRLSNRQRGRMAWHAPPFAKNNVQVPTRAVDRAYSPARAPSDQRTLQVPAQRRTMLPARQAVRRLHRGDRATAGDLWREPPLTGPDHRAELGLRVHRPTRAA